MMNFLSSSVLALSPSREWRVEKSRHLRSGGLDDVEAENWRIASGEARAWRRTVWRQEPERPYSACLSNENNQWDGPDHCIARDIGGKQYMCKQQKSKGIK